MRVFVGDFDGYQLERVDQILRLQFGTRYCKDMAILMKHRNTDLPLISIDKENPKVGLLELIRSNNRIARISILDTGTINGQGCIEKIENNVCKVRQVDDEGEADGVGFLKIKDISRISFGGEDEIRLETLYISKTTGRE